MKNFYLPTLPLLMLSAAISISLIGCGNSTSASNDETPDDPSTVEVEMLSQSFAPSDIEIETGTTVIWVNGSSAVHTVTSGTDGNHDGNFDSGNVSPGQEFSFTFDEAGNYPYYCIPHLDLGMTGNVTVVDAP